MDNAEIIANAINDICSILKEELKLCVEDYMTLDHIEYQMSCIIEEVKNDK